MSNTIEILKKIFETNKSVMFEDEKEALKKGILALDSVESLKARVTSLSEQKEKVDMFVVEVFNRLKERAEFDRARAETDLKILEKWKKDYKELE